MDDAELVRRDIQKCLKPRDPLLKKLPAMDENQGVPFPCRDHFARQQRSCRMPWSLRARRFRAREEPRRPHFCSGVNSPRNRVRKGPSLLAFVAQLGGDADVCKKAQQIIETSSREGDVFRRTARHKR